jgi:hypothetical protein
VLIEEATGGVLRLLHEAAADLLDQLTPVLFPDLLELLLLVGVEWKLHSPTGLQPRNGK